MKKILLYCSLVAIFFLGTKSTIAQGETKSPEAIAKEKTYKLSQEIGLDGNQQRLVWRTFLAREKAKIEIEQSDLTSKHNEKAFMKADESFDLSMQEYLTDEQYGKFKKIAKEYL